MMLIVGSIPDRGFPLTTGEVEVEDNYLIVDGRRFSSTQGTGAMISAALTTTSYLKLQLSPKVLALHYCQPIMTLIKKLCQAVKECAPKPLMIADAGAMYAVKGAGLAQEFDILTPDPSEIAFLADPLATHPAYMAKHLFGCEPIKIPEQITATYKNKSAATFLLVKGETDYVAKEGKILATINEPDVPTLEAIGGTGDTITGLVSAFVYAGLKPHEAAIIAAKANRMAGKFAQPTPATKVKQIIDQFPAVFKEYLCQWQDTLSCEVELAVCKEDN